ncbi:recombinase family protein [Candidatus Margulisiibacteriota bacterium]
MGKLKIVIDIKKNFSNVKNRIAQLHTLVRTEASKQQRIRDKIFEKAKKGLWGCGRAPFGYKRDGNKLVVESKEAEIVRLIFEAFIKNRSTWTIYKQLKDKRLFNRAGRPISKSMIDSILKGVVHSGMVEHKGKVYQGLHEPIIAKELFDEVQAIRKENVRPKKIMTYNFSLFPGLIRCKECDSVMSSVFTNKIRHKNNKRTRYFYYRCSLIDKQDRSFCSIRQVSTDRLDKFIIDNLDKIRKNKQYLDSLIYVLNHNGNDDLNGLEPSGSYLPVKAERLQEILKNVFDASKLKSKTEKRLIIKRHIEKVIYSKETIEVIILYSDSVATASGPLRDPSAELRSPLEKKDAAIFRQLSSPQNRRPSPMVRCKGKMPGRRFELLRF